MQQLMCPFFTRIAAGQPANAARTLTVSQRCKPSAGYSRICLNKSTGTYSEKYDR